MKKCLLLSLILSACASEPESPESVYLRTAEGVLRVVPVDQGNGWLLVNGDILVREDELQRNIVEHPDADVLVPYAGVRSVGEMRWENHTVRFHLHANLSAAQRTAVEDAIAHWEEVTPYEFVEATDGDFVTFSPGNNDGTCSSAVGRVGGEQFIEVDTCPWGRIAHEIGHTVGFFHEQTRLDRDTYVTINWDNIIDSCEDQYETFAQRGRDGQHIGPYDYGSIMHYSTTQCDEGGPTMTPTQTGVSMGQRNALSLWDRYAAEVMASGLNTAPASGPSATVFADASYQGARQTFPPGRYSASYLTTVGDNQITSAIVPAGLSVRLCQGATWPNFDQCLTLSGNTTQLPAAFDNAVSIVDVERAVTAYRGSNLTGISQTFRVGNHAANAGQLATVGNDQISSLIVPPGLVAELCFSESGTGSTGSYCRTYEGTVNFVGDFMDDEASLIRVKRAVTLFQESKLWGNRKSLVEGTWTAFAPVSGVSSMAVADGLQVRACSGSSGQAPCATYRGDVHHVGPDLNDNIRWVRVEPNVAP